MSPLSMLFTWNSRPKVFAESEIWKLQQEPCTKCYSKQEAENFPSQKLYIPWPRLN